MGSISLGWALVAGKKRSPRPAAGIIAFLTFFINIPPIRIFFRKYDKTPRHINSGPTYARTAAAYWDGLNMAPGSRPG
ncbi:MAG: hypothetical protein BWY80_00659 [Firmicutes bacterium ADurb.Bin456]|nr:MAG: hypothetical protein BWY80_00659 [Firmicutes bacterium ADurb.Bin456]